MCLFFHFELLFYRWCQVRFQLPSFACYYLVIPASFVEWCWHLCWKSIGNRCVNLFLDFWLYYIDLHVCPMPAAHCFIYCSIVLSFKIGKYESSNSVLFQIVLDIKVTLHFHMNFTIGLSISAKKGSWNFHKDCTALDLFGEYCHLNIKSFNLQHRCLHSFRSFLISFNNVL